MAIDYGREEEHGKHNYRSDRRHVHPVQLILYDAFHYDNWQRLCPHIGEYQSEQKLVPSQHGNEYGSGGHAGGCQRDCNTTVGSNP